MTAAVCDACLASGDSADISGVIAVAGSVLSGARSRMRTGLTACPNNPGVLHGEGVAAERVWRWLTGTRTYEES